MKQIVLVDDNADHIELMVLALRAIDLHWPVVTFSSGALCVAAVAQGHVDPHLVVLDLNMPGLDGPAAVQRLRVLDAMRTVPIVMMSTSEQAADVRRAHEAGAVCFVAKPGRDQTWLGVMNTVVHCGTQIDCSGHA